MVYSPYMGSTTHCPYLKIRQPRVCSLRTFIEFISTTLPVHQNNLYIGDFNLHVSEDSTDPTIFNDSIDVMGLNHHVGFPTHKSGNILALILSDIQQPTTVMATAQGPFLTDHRAVTAILNIKKLNGCLEVRKLKNIAQDQWIDEFNPDNVPLNSKLLELVTSFNNELSGTLDKLALLKKQKVNLRPKNPWCDSDLKAHKRLMRKKERMWLKYKLESCRTTYKNTETPTMASLTSRKNK